MTRREGRGSLPVEAAAVEAIPPLQDGLPLPASVRSALDAAKERHKRRPASPGVRITQRDGQADIRPARGDLEAWEVQICDAFGSRSMGLMWTFLDQLVALCSLSWSDDGEGSGSWQPDEQQLNAMLAMINGVRPKNEMEAALAAQMVAVHFMTMRVAGHTLEQGAIDPRSAAVAGKLARTFAMQMDALGRARGKVGRQTIKVKYGDRHSHQHVHKHEHAHLHGDTGRGGVNYDGQPVATSNRSAPRIVRAAICSDVSPAREHGDGATVRGQDALGRVVPIRSGTRQG